MLFGSRSILAISFSEHFSESNSFLNSVWVTRKLLQPLSFSEVLQTMTNADQMVFWSKKGTSFNKEWAKRTSQVCKPCWELKYCPYGELVEQFPVPLDRPTVEHHIRFLIEQLAKGAYSGKKKKEFQRRVKELKPRNFPRALPQRVKDMTCSIFGHLCPVYFVNEPFSETVRMRKVTRHVSRDVALRVARRDNYTCQICGRSLRDYEIEFHHRIPYSKGGSTSEDNLEVACSDCNKEQGAEIPDDI
jgi:hypothetical protein